MKHLMYKSSGGSNSTFRENKIHIHVNDLFILFTQLKLISDVTDKDKILSEINICHILFSLKTNYSTYLFF